MTVVLINGSPKINNSASGILLEDLRKFFPKEVQITEAGMHKECISKEVLRRLEHADVWVFAFPLYVDGIPAHLLSCLVQLEKSHVKDRKRCISGIVNCGFYEGIQAETGLSILENWSIKAGYIWGGGIGVGGGGGLAMMPSPKSGKGPKAPIDKELKVLAGNIMEGKAQRNRYVSVAFPRVLYKMAAQAGWRQMIRANGRKIRDLGRNGLTAG